MAISKDNPIRPSYDRAIAWCDGHLHLVESDYESCLAVSIALEEERQQMAQERREGVVLAMLFVLFLMAYICARRWLVHH